MTTTSQLRSLMASSQSRCDSRYKAVASCRGCSALPSRSPSSPRPLLAACGSGSSAPRGRHGRQCDGEHQRRHGRLEPRRRAARRRAAECAWSRSATSRPRVYVTAPPGDKRRLFIVEQAGGSSSSAAASPRPSRSWTSGSKVTAGGEQGLLSMAFAPDYAQSGLLLRLLHREERHRGDLGVPPRRRRPRRPQQRPARAAHGRPRAQPQRRPDDLRPDKLMYVGTGDGGGGNDQHGPRGNAQSLGSLLGKILRIDPKAVGRQGVHDPVLEPVRRARGRPRRDLLLRAAQPVALLLRPRHR